MQRIGEDVAEELDYVPGVFTVGATFVASGPAPSASPSPRLQLQRM